MLSASFERFKIILARGLELNNENYPGSN